MATRTPTTPRVGLTMSNVAATPTAAIQHAGGVGSHPVEVVGRIREHPDGRDEPSAIRVLPNGRDLQIRQENQLQYREFSLDGVSRAELESLESFYKKYVEARVDDVKGGGKCTIMMYGPTGAGKSHTMFGSSNRMGDRGVASLALTQIMGAVDGSTSGEVTVRASVWEIFNEEIYDLLAQTSNPPGSMKGATNRVKLVMRGHRVVNSHTTQDTDPSRLLSEIKKVEKRRVTKSTNCNDRSSRSHCVVTFEIPDVGGRLVLVDMAGSENIEQAGTGNGMDAKMQTGKINQGNGALKRVVEAIAANSEHIPYRDSKLTMILQESFEHVNAKILMILCASPCPKDVYKTLGTFEYGAKAKTIVRLPNSPAKEKVNEANATQFAQLAARIANKDASIISLRRDKEKSEREREASDRAREAKEKEVNDLKKKVEEMRLEITKRDFDMTKRKLEALERELEKKEKELEFQRSRADKAEAELNELKRSFSSLKSDPLDSTGRSIKHVKVESPGSRTEKLRILSSLCLPEKTNTLDSSNPQPGLSASSPKTETGKYSTPVAKKFSSSVLSFFRSNNDSQDQAVQSSKKSSPLVQEETVKSKESTSPAPTSNADDRKRGSFQPSSTLRDLLNSREEEQQVSHVVREPRQEDANPSWQSMFNQQSIGKDLQTEGESMLCDSSPEEKDDEEVELSRHCEKDPLGLITWSEAKLHRKGWLPIIIEEQEDEGEDGHSSAGASGVVGRPFASCPRLSDGGLAQKLNSTIYAAESPSRNPSSSSEPASPNFYPSNLLRDKFLPMSASKEESSAFERRLDGGGGMPRDSNALFMGSSSSQSGSVAEKELDAKSLRPEKNEESSPTKLLLGRNGQGPESDGSVERQFLAGGVSEPVVEAESARKARIENIFRLCGHSREVAARSTPGVESPISRSPLSGRASPDPHGSASHVVRELYSTLDSISPFSPPQPRASPIGSPYSHSFRENRSHLSLEADGYYSPVRVTRSFDDLLYQNENVSSYMSSPLPVLPSPQKSDSPARHRKFRNGNLFTHQKQNEMGASMKLQGVISPKPETSPRLSASPGYSVAAMANVYYADENVPISNVAGGGESPMPMLCDVYVKWESSKEVTSGKLICVLKIAKGASLADLRREILPNISTTTKHGFNFLMLGDAGGAPVEKELEGDLRVSSLPDAPNNPNSRLASLRPPSTQTLFAAPNRAVTPFRPLENQLSAAAASPMSSKSVGSKSERLNSSGSSGKSASGTGSNGSMSLVKGLRTLASGVGIRSGSSLKEKSTSAHVQEIASKYLV